MDQYQRELGDINRHSDGLAEDVEQTIKKLDDDTKKDEVKRELRTLVGKLKGIAGTHKPDPNAPDPTDPNVTGKSKDQQKKTAESEEQKENREKLNEENKNREENSSDKRDPFGQRADPFKG